MSEKSPSASEPSARSALVFLRLLVVFFACGGIGISIGLWLYSEALVGPPGYHLLTGRMRGGTMGLGPDQYVERVRSEMFYGGAFGFLAGAAWGILVVRQLGRAGGGQFGYLLAGVALLLTLLLCSGGIPH